MKDYKQYVGREVSVFTAEGSLVGELMAVGQHTLTVKAEAMYDDRGEPGPTPKGVMLVEGSAITWVQVR